MTSPVMLPAMSEEQRAAFYAYYPRVQRDELTGVVLAVLLGSFGAHHFYLRRPGLGLLYALFCWTSIPFLLGLIEAFFMPARVRDFNAEQAAILAQAVMHEVVPPTSAAAMVGCARCGRVQRGGARFCLQCGASIA